MEKVIKVITKVKLCSKIGVGKGSGGLERYQKRALLALVDFLTPLLTQEVIQIR